MRSCYAYHPSQFGIFSFKIFIRLPAHPPGHRDDPEALLPRAAARGWGGVSVRLRWFRLSQRETQGLHRYNVFCSCILEQLLKIQNPWITPGLNSSSLSQRLYCNIHKKTRIFNFDVRSKVFKMPFFCQTLLGKETPCCMDRRRETARSSTMT